MVQAEAADLRSQHGIASVYWQPQKIACPPYGQFNPNKLTAAHRTLPCGTNVTVINKRNGISVNVTINDRGPFVRGRIIDLSLEAARRIELTKKQGLAPVEIRW